jgi:FkbM family methyltransferase
VLTGEDISRGILAFGYSELALTAVMIEFLEPGMRVVDVGAHLGYEAMLASAIVGREGRVVSFEPQKQMAGWTVKNLQQYPQARVVKAAAGQSKGKASFTECNIVHSAFSGQGTGSENSIGRQYEIEVTTIDEALVRDERPVDLIKCDAEGSEMLVLRGALNVLKEDKPLLLLEAGMPDHAEFGPRVKEFEELLGPMGYRGLSFDYDAKLKVAPIGSILAGHANVTFIHHSKAHRLTNLIRE